MSEIDLNLDLVSKYQREGQDKKLEKVLAQIDIDLLNSKYNHFDFLEFFVRRIMRFFLKNGVVKSKESVIIMRLFFIYT